MGTQITFRRGSTFPTAGSGITLSEPVFETTLHTFHIGLGYGITAEWVGAPISALSGDIAAGITYKIPTAEAVKNYISGLCFGNTAGGGGGGSVSSVSGSGNGILISPTTGAVVVSNTGVHSFNGLTGAVGITAGTGITLTASGNTITIASTLGTSNSTTQTLDFSETINGLEIVFSGSGGDFGTLLSYVENYKTITAIIESGGAQYSVVLDTIQSFYDPTNGWSARLVAKAPFVDTTTLGVNTAQAIVDDTITTIYLDLTSSSGLNIVDYWTTINSTTVYHQEETYAVKTVTGQTWVTADSYITCKVLGITTADHTPEDAILEGVQFEINNIVAGTGFDIIGHAPEGTYGKYTVKCIEQ